MAAGLVTGYTQAVDSAFVKANASLESLCEKQPVDALTPVLHVADKPAQDVLDAPPLRASPEHHLRRVAAAHARDTRNDRGPLGRDRPQVRLLSNKTHYSLDDPDTRISVKPGKACALNYLCSMAVEEGHGVISHIQADFADRRNSTLLPSIIAPLHQRLLAQELLVEDVVADTNYSNGLNYALLEARGIPPWIPVFGQYKPEMEGFTYDKEAECFTCPAGKPLPFKRFDADLDGRLSKRYSAATGDCRRCPRKSTCIPKSKSRKITRTAYDTHYRRALARQRTVEPVFGILLQHYGLRRVNPQGRSSAHKTMLLTAVAFNLKKLLKHQPKQVLRRAIALLKPAGKQQLLPFWRSYYRREQQLGNRRQTGQEFCNSHCAFWSRAAHPFTHWH